MSPALKSRSVRASVVAYLEAVDELAKRRQSAVAYIGLEPLDRRKHSLDVCNVSGTDTVSIDLSMHTIHAPHRKKSILSI